MDNRITRQQQQQPLDDLQHLTIVIPDYMPEWKRLRVAKHRESWQWALCWYFKLEHSQDLGKLTRHYKPRGVFLQRMMRLIERVCSTCGGDSLLWFHDIFKEILEYPTTPQVWEKQCQIVEDGTSRKGYTKEKYLSRCRKDADTLDGWGNPVDLRFMPRMHGLLEQFIELKEFYLDQPDQTTFRQLEKLWVNFIKAYRQIVEIEDSPAWAMTEVENFILYQRRGRGRGKSQVKPPSDIEYIVYSKTNP